MKKKLFLLFVMMVSGLWSGVYAGPWSPTDKTSVLLAQGVSQAEKDRAQEVIDSIKVTIREYRNIGSAKKPQFVSTTSDVKSYIGLFKDVDDVVRRLSMLNEDLFYVYGKPLSLKYLKEVELCVNVGCGAVVSLSKIVLPATPQNFHYLPGERLKSNYFLSYRQERVSDIHEFAHLLDFNRYVDMTSFWTINWTHPLRTKALLPGWKPEDFLTSDIAKNKAAEDFAESVGYYVFRRDLFLTQSKSSVALTRKYQWVKQNVFNHVEFTDDYLKQLFKVR